MKGDNATFLHMKPIVYKNNRSKLLSSVIKYFNKVTFPTSFQEEAMIIMPLEVWTVNEYMTVAPTFLSLCTRVRCPNCGEPAGPVFPDRRTRDFLSSLVALSAVCKAFHRLIKGAAESEPTEEQPSSSCSSSTPWHFLCEGMGFAGDARVPCGPSLFWRSLRVLLHHQRTSKALPPSVAEEYRWRGISQAQGILHRQPASASSSDGSLCCQRFQPSVLSGGFALGKLVLDNKVEVVEHLLRAALCSPDDVMPAYNRMVSIPGGSGYERFDDKEFPLLIAAANGRTEIFSLLLTYGANVNQQTKETGVTAAMATVYRRQPLLLEMLLRHETKDNSEEQLDVEGMRDNESKFTAWHYCFKRHVPEALVVLLRERAGRERWRGRSGGVEKERFLKELLLLGAVQCSVDCVLMLLRHLYNLFLEKEREKPETEEEKKEEAKGDEEANYESILHWFCDKVMMDMLVHPDERALEFLKRVEAEFIGIASAQRNFSFNRRKALLSAIQLRRWDLVNWILFSSKKDKKRHVKKATEEEEEEEEEETVITEEVRTMFAFRSTNAPKELHSLLAPKGKTSQLAFNLSSFWQKHDFNINNNWLGKGDTTSTTTFFKRDPLPPMTNRIGEALRMFQGYRKLASYDRWYSSFSSSRFEVQAPPDNGALEVVLHLLAASLKEKEEQQHKEGETEEEKRKRKEREQRQEAENKEETLLVAIDLYELCKKGDVKEWDKPLSECFRKKGRRKVIMGLEAMFFGHTEYEKDSIPLDMTINNCGPAGICTLSSRFTRRRTMAFGPSLTLSPPNEEERREIATAYLTEEKEEDGEERKKKEQEVARRIAEKTCSYGHVVRMCHAWQGLTRMKKEKENEEGENAIEELLSLSEGLKQHCYEKNLVVILARADGARFDEETLRELFEEDSV
ncbi:hypothetical protein QOT17_008357 [Balamuthia mandrillaris]